MSLEVIARDPLSIDSRIIEARAKVSAKITELAAARAELAALEKQRALEKAS